MVWNASNLNDEEFVDEVAKALGAFASSDKRYVINLKIQMKKQKEQIYFLEEILKNQKLVTENEHQKQIDS